MSMVMILFIFSSKTQSFMIWVKLFLSVFFAGATLILVETGVRIADSDSNLVVPTDSAKLFGYLQQARISGREIGNQMLIHNIALFSKYPDPGSITRAYVGTSRTKILRPEWFGISNAINGSGNTYNEISYGLLLQAEILRLRFPNLRRVYFESSLLLRRPARLIVEDDHRKYLPLLETLLPLRDRVRGEDGFRHAVKNEIVGHVEQDSRVEKDLYLHVLKKNSDFRFYKLFVEEGVESSVGIPVLEDKWLAQLNQNGERKLQPGGLIQPKDQKPSITNEHIKVQRLSDIPEWEPWDGLFDLIALWGREYGIEIVFFQPPVRSDLYQFQLKSGLEAHVRDLKRVAKLYNVPFINLNQPEMMYMDDWSIFSDEDHMETCPGVIYLQFAIEAGYEKFRKTGDLFPVENKTQVQKDAAEKLNLCNGNEIINVKNQ